MADAAWADISDESKDLVDLMLNKYPQQRISIKEILGHPWLFGVAPDTVLEQRTRVASRIWP
jgi:serine/threonine protein kinase